MPFVDPALVPSTGNAAVDRAHRSLAEDINRVYEAWTVNTPKAEVANLLADLLHHYQRHFQHEKFIVRGAPYRDWSDHHRIHDDFLVRVSRLATELEKNRTGVRETMEELAALMDSLLYEHEVYGDGDYRAIVRDNGSASADEPLVTWQPEFEVGSEEVNDEHRALVNMLNEMHAEAVQGDGSKRFYALLEEFRGYVATHFSSEERYMVETGNKMYDEHKMAHDILTDELDFIIEQYSHRHFHGMHVTLVHSLKYWLLDHVVNMDRKL